MVNHKASRSALEGCFSTCLQGWVCHGGQSFLGSRSLPRDKQQQQQSDSLLWLHSAGAATFVSAAWKNGHRVAPSQLSVWVSSECQGWTLRDE